MKRHAVTAGDIAKVIEKSYPPALKKINMKTTFDIIEAKKIIDYLLQKEKDFLYIKFGDEWQTEWEKRWGHITNWFEYLFFDEMVTVTNVGGSKVSNF